MNRYQRLLKAVCVKYGYCGSVIDNTQRHVNDFIPDFGFVSAEQFTNWVFLADGVDPGSTTQAQKNHQRDIRAAFVEIMGAETVYATELKPDAPE